VGLLRRLFGRGSTDDERAGDGEPAPSASSATAPASAAELDSDERARELDLLREEQARFDDLIVRQQRYADRSWVPPAQGGPRRSDDGEATAGEDR
jgi:hypothetical protein